jgi:hypothetical protein
MPLLKNFNQIFSKFNKISKHNCNIINLNSYFLSFSRFNYYKNNVGNFKSLYLFQINKFYHTSYSNNHIRNRQKNFKITSIDKLDEKIVDELWANNQRKMHNFTRDEFNSLINCINAIIFNWVQTFDSMAQRRMAIELLFDVFNKKLASKFINKPENWSIFFDNFDPILKLIINKYPIEMLPFRGEEKYLFDNFDLVIRDLIKQLNEALVPKFQLNNINKIVNTKTIGNLKFITDLNESFVVYLTKYNSNKNEINFNAINSLTKTIANYIRYLIYLNKMIPSDLAKSNQQYKNYIEKLDSYTQKLMSYHNNSSSIGPNIKTDFYYYFSFNKENWLKSTQALISSYGNVELFDNIDYECFSSALCGAIRFNDMDLFIKLCYEINKKHYKHFIHFQNSLQSIFYEYILLRKNDSDFDQFLVNLFKSWNLLEFVSYNPLIEQLKKCISESKNNWIYEEVTIDHQGKCSNGLLVPVNKYNRQSLDETAEIIKQITINETSLTDIHVDAFTKLDQLMAKNKFNVVIDGLNLIYNIQTGIDRVSFIKLRDILQQLQDLNLNNILLIFRHHVFRRLCDDLEKLKKHYPNLKFFYLDDKIKDDLYMIYASLKSRSFIVTHDELTNHVNRLDLNWWTLKNWLYNKRFRLNNSKTFIIYPYLFKPVTQKANQGEDDAKWFIPYDSHNSFNMDFRYPNRYLVVEKIKK